MGSEAVMWLLGNSTDEVNRSLFLHPGWSRTVQAFLNLNIDDTKYHDAATIWLRNMSLQFFIDLRYGNRKDWIETIRYVEKMHDGFKRASDRKDREKQEFYRMKADADAIMSKSVENHKTL